MKLAYRDTPAEAPGPPAVVLHREGMASTGDLATVALASGAVGRVVAPFGDYAYTANGMEVAGVCWYRILPGFAGTDPISLVKAVVQVGDLLDDLNLEHPVLIGWGQGGVVALGAGLLAAGMVESVVCVDVPPAHVELLPAAAWATIAPPRLLLVATEVIDHPTRDEVRTSLGRRGVDATTWQWSGEGGPEDRDKALAQRIGSWLEHG
jgi:pimeloyl-ACP methyl ester carboxylesterase